MPYLKEVPLTEQEKSFLKEYLERELQTQTLSNTSKKILINLITKLGNE